MSIKPILFSGPMVRAILEGRKTQTRRVLKTQPTSDDIDNSGDGIIDMADGVYIEIPIHPDDLIYVREAWKTFGMNDEFPPRELIKGTTIHYVADNKEPHGVGRFRQGMHMPRWASRITLKVTEVRVQRLQDISEQDAIVEGADVVISSTDGLPWVKGNFNEMISPREWFKRLWDSINATSKGGIYSWDKNPWVAAYTFEPIFQNVDQIGGGS